MGGDSLRLLLSNLFRGSKLKHLLQIEGTTRSNSQPIKGDFGKIWKGSEGHWLEPMEGILSFSPKPPSSVISRQSPPTRLFCRFSTSLPRSDIRIQSSESFRRRSRTRCRSLGGNSSSTPDSDEKDSKAALDAFFLGKALAEAVNERIASNVGEFLSIIGQWQAEQQKQVQDFQEEVIQKAKKEKEKAAAEALAMDGGGGAVSARPSVPAIGRLSSEPNDDDDDDDDDDDNDDPLENMLKG